MKSSIVFFGLVLFFIPACLHGQTTENKADTLIVKRTTNFDISGEGNAPQWESTDWIQLIRRKGTTDYNTRAKLLYSETGVYCLFSCEDKKITATLKEDFARLWTEDVVEIFFWPDESAPLYFEYELSPLNYEIAILVPNMDGHFLGWRPWQYEGSRKTRHALKVLRDKKGNPFEWIAEFFIPYELLKPLRNIPPKKGTAWRMNMYRIDYDNGNTSWSWKPVQDTFHDYKHFGVITFE
jgi:hypothetical protein